MSGNTQYVVSIKLRPDDEVTGAVKALLNDVKQSQAGAGDTAKAAKAATVDYTTKFRESFGHMGRAVQGFRSELHFLRGTYQTLTNITGVGVKDIVSTALDWNVSLESIGLSVATVLSSVDMATKGPFADFNDAQKKTTDLFKLMREEAKATPVEFEDIADAFNTMLPLTRSLLPDLESIVKLSANASSWDVMAGLQKGTTARDIRQILGGQVAITQIQNPLIKNRLDELKDLMKDARALEKKGGAGAGLANQKEALRIMRELLEIPPKARAAWEDSFEGLSNNIKGVFKQLFVEGSAGVFGDVKGWLQDITLDMEKNPQKYRDAAKDFAEFVKAGAVFMYDVFKFFYDNFGVVKTVFGSFVAVWTFINAMKFVGGVYAFAAAIMSGELKAFILALAGFTKNPVAAAAAGAAGAAGAGATEVGAGTLAARYLLAGAARLGSIGALLANPDDSGPKSTVQELRDLTAARIAGFQSMLGMTDTGMSQFAQQKTYMTDEGVRGPLYEGTEELIRKLNEQAASKYGSLNANERLDFAASVGAILEATRPQNIAGAATTDRKDQQKLEATLNINVNGNADVTTSSSNGFDLNINKGVKAVGQGSDL